MADLPMPDRLTEAEFALFGLVATLERDDFRNPLGVPVTGTTAFLDARTLVRLLVLLGRTPGQRH